MFFGDFLVCFDKVVFVSVVLIPIRNTETNRNKPKKMFLVSRNKPKNNRNRLGFGLFWFEPEINLIVSRTPYSGLSRHVVFKKHLVKLYNSLSRSRLHQNFRDVFKTTICLEGIKAKNIIS